MCSYVMGDMGEGLEEKRGGETPQCQVPLVAGA